MKLAIYVLLLMAMAVISGQAQGREFFFVQIADTQLGFTTQNKDLGPDIASLEKAVDKINKTSPAFVVVSGDLTNAANDPAQTSAFLRCIRKIKKGIGVFLVPGNHDMYSATKEDLLNYRNAYGKDYYSYNCRGSVFITLDSPLLCHKTADEDARKAQRMWFEARLASAKRKKPDHIFVFTHHPWFLQNPNEEDSYWTVPTPIRQEYVGLIQKYGVDYAAAGHYHREALGKADGLTMITTAPLAVAMGSEPIGLKVFKVYKDRVEAKYYSLKDIPDEIEM